MLRAVNRGSNSRAVAEGGWARLQLLNKTRVSPMRGAGAPVFQTLAQTFPGA